MKASKIELDISNSTVGELQDALEFLPRNSNVQVLIRWGGWIKKVIITPPTNAPGMETIEGM